MTVPSRRPMPCRRLVLVAVLAAGALSLAACGRKEVVAGRAAETVASFIASHTGFHPTDVRCPSGVEARAGQSFDCHFTGPDGPYVAHMHITSVSGTRVSFDIHSQPVGGISLTAAGSADVVDRFLVAHTRFHARDTRCPEVHRAAVGTTFDCHFTGPDGPYVAHLRVAGLAGRRVDYAVRTRRIR